MAEYDLEFVRELGKQLRVDSIRSSTAAGSGHPTSSMSASDLLAVLLARHLQYDWDNPDEPNNDHLIFSHHPDLAVQAVHDRFVLLSQAGQALIGAREHDAAWKAARSRLRDAEAVSLDQVEQELLATSQKGAAERVKHEVAAFESERKYIDKQLGFSTAAPASSSGSSGSEPGGQATAIP